MHDKNPNNSADKTSNNDFNSRTELHERVKKIVESAKIFDVHTHLYPPQFGAFNLWGIDELLNYHYLIAEFFRSSETKPGEFRLLEKTKRSDLIWQSLFVENTPLSEATGGVITVLNQLGLNTKAANLREARDFFESQKAEDYLENVLKVAGVSDIVMTNDPFDAEEISFWENNSATDSRFHASLRLDTLLNNWENAVSLFEKQGYRVSNDLSEKTIAEIRRFLKDWAKKIAPLYLAVSLPDDFVYPENSPRGLILKKAVLPFCREHQIPLCLMIGVRRQINPALDLAGDGLGRADVSSLSRLCVENADVRFLATFLSRENQHELCVVARKFSNLMPFGCWWFLNNPSIISEITRERFELLGTGFIPQHSDARILDQLIYKWKHSRRVIADALYDSYERLVANGRTVSTKEIERDVKKLFSGNFQNWVGKF